jgi:hypothetical protein
MVAPRGPDRVLKVVDSMSDDADAPLLGKKQKISAAMS